MFSDNKVAENQPNTEWRHFPKNNSVPPHKTSYNLPSTPSVAFIQTIAIKIKTKMWSCADIRRGDNWLPSQCHSGSFCLWP